MPDPRRLKLDLTALGVFAASALLACALATYDPVDYPSDLVSPPSPHVANACGPVGAIAAHWLFSALGYVAYFAVGGLGWLGGTLLRRRPLNQPLIRAAGWSVLLAASATLLTLLLPGQTPGPAAGAGGYVGAMGFAWLDAHFAAAGGLILALAAAAAGVLLSTDYFLLRFVADGATTTGAALARLAQRDAAANSASETTAAAGGASALLASPEGNAAPSDADADEEDAQYEYEYEYEYEEEEESADGAQKEWEEESLEDDAATAAPLKVKTPQTKQLEEAAVPALAPPDVASESPLIPSAPSLSPSVDNVLAPLPIKDKRQRAPKATERDAVIHQLEAAESQPVEDVDYELPPLDLLLAGDDVSYDEHEKEVRRKAKILEKTFKDFGFNVKVVEIETGPVIAQFEVELEAGLRLSKIVGLADDLAIALRVPSVRIVAPIPGKNSVGIEVPNEHRQLVRLRDVIEECNGKAKRMKIPLYLGKDVAGNPLSVDLTALPHLLIAGRTGTGKSVCLNSIIASILMTRGPDEVRMLMIDPKMVELSGYKKLPHLMHPVVTDMRKAEAILGWAVDKMEERYALLARAGVRHVTVYNQLSEEELRERIEPASEVEWEQIPRNLPFIVIVADEMADLMMTSGKEVEQHIIRLAQKSRAVGIHLILATQKPTVDVITGLIKSNLPARIAFQVASRTDSRVVLDEMGADKLLGNGDMLFLSPGTSQLLRGQGTFLSDDEITRITDFVATDSPEFARELIELKTTDEQEEEAAPVAGLKKRDELYEAAVDVVVRERRGSVSLLQRCLGIGYGRAARLIDFMAEDGIVGEYNGSQARDVVISIEDWEAMSAASRGEGPASGDGGNAPLTAATVPPKPKRNNRVLPVDDERDAEGDFVSSAPTRYAPTPPRPRSAAPVASEAGGVAILAAPWEVDEVREPAPIDDARGLFDDEDAILDQESEEAAFETDQVDSELEDAAAADTDLDSSELDESEAVRECAVAAVEQSADVSLDAEGSVESAPDVDEGDEEVGEETGDDSEYEYVYEYEEEVAEGGSSYGEADDAESDAEQVEYEYEYEYEEVDEDSDDEEDAGGVWEEAAADDDFDPAPRTGRPPRAESA